MKPEVEQQLPISGDCRCNIAQSVSLQDCPPWGALLAFQSLEGGFHQQWSPRPEGCRAKRDWPDAMVTQRLVGDRTGRKRQGPLSGEGPYTGETPNDFPHLRDTGCSLVQEAQEPLGEVKNLSPLPGHGHPSSQAVSVS